MKHLPIWAVRCQICLLLTLGGLVPAVPSAAQVIRDIRFEREPVFTDDDRHALPWLPLGLVNRMHVDTRLQVIRRALLFDEGETLDPAVLEETARKIRGLGIFADAEILTVEAPGDSVDVIVRTRELWTTALNVAYDRYEDETLWTVQLREKNFLGTARGFEVSRREDPDRDAWTVGLNDRQMIDGTWAGGVRWSDASDGSSISWRLDRSFVQLTGDWAVGMGYRDGQSSPRYYVAEGLYVRPDVRRTAAGFEWGRRAWLGKKGVWRWLTGAEFEYQNFSAQEPLNLWTPSGELPITVPFPPEVAEDHRWNTIYAGVERRTRRFEQARYLFAMGTREDLAIGPELVLRTGWTARWLGSSVSGLWFTAGHEWFHRLSRHWLQHLRVDGRGLFGGSEGQDARVVAALSQYHQPLQPLTLAWGITAGMAKEIDRSEVFHVGLASGLRAARFHELAGDRLLRGNAELRLVETSGLFRLITPGIVVFSDFGTAWFEDQSDFTWDQVRGAYGFGFRFGFNRAAADVPIRVDFAWPMLYPTEQPAPVISIGTGHLF